MAATAGGSFSARPGSPSLSERSAAGSADGATAHSGGHHGSKEIFSVEERLQIPLLEQVELYAKHSEGSVNYFAVLVKGSGDLLLTCDHKWPLEGSERGWVMKAIPWFDDPAKRISAMVFDDEGILFLGTWDGSILELRVKKVLLTEGERTAAFGDADLLEVCHLNNIRVLHMLVYNQDSNKIILCSGEHGKFVILTNHAPPVLVTFTSSILGVELFVNKAGLTCALVCLESGQNVFTVLDDLDLPAVPESHGKKSIFKKAKDNLMSRLSEEKLSFFGKKSNKESAAAGGSPNSSLTNVAQSVISNAAVTAPSIIVGHVSSQKSSNAPLNNVKFQSIDERLCRGLLKKIGRQGQFFRVGSNKLDIFDGDFRQMSTTYVPPSIVKIEAIQRMFFAWDEENHCLRTAIIIDSVFKEFASVPLSHKVLGVEAFGEEGTPYTVFVVCENGILEMTLRKTPLETCVNLMLTETGTNVVDAVCSALNVPKSQVCIMAGDRRSEEGKFSKTILYYKLGGLNYAQSCAKFGSRGQIPAMLFFFELVDQERSKFVGAVQDRQLMTDLAVLGRVEQYLRYGLVRSELPKNPEILLRSMLLSNMYYSSAKATQYLAVPELLWALKLVAKSRHCYPDLLLSLQENDSTLTHHVYTKRIFWNLVTADWFALYTADACVFIWFRGLVWKLLRRISTPILLKIIRLLLPWRRELQRKIFTEVSDLVNIIDFTSCPDTERVEVDDYVSLFLILLIEAIRRKETKLMKVPEYEFKADARLHQKKEIANHKNNMVATMMLSYTFMKTFSASSHHCICIRNGRAYSWGENKMGRLGVGEHREKLTVDTPTPISLPTSLRLYIESVCAGTNHTIALTNVGTLLVWGSNKFGQLGLGRTTQWTGRPVPLDIPDVIFTCVAAGNYHSVAVDHLNRVWMWGWGAYGQLGTGDVENVYFPTLVDLEDKVVFASAGHSHTALLTCYGRVLICGCNHFGQLGLGMKEGKVKVPTLLNTMPAGTLIRLVECGVCSTVLVTTKNRLYYCGLNPASLRSLLSGSKKKEKLPQEKVANDEEKDFNEPMLIDTSHMAGDITKVSASSTHFGVMTSLGYVYTWGIGKSGQLARNDDDTKTLELIDCDSKMLVASDIGCGGDCTFVIERETGTIYGCGFNSVGQLGKMESDEEHSVMTVRTKKRVVKIRQPSNIHFRLREIPGLPQQMAWEGENSVISTHKIVPHTNIIGQELLEWCLNVFRRNYDARFMTARCLEAGNLAAASLLETLTENHEQALKISLDAARENLKESETAIHAYTDAVNGKTPSVEQASRFLSLVIQHWSKYTLPNSALEEILERLRKHHTWGHCYCQAIRETITVGDKSATWIAANLTPIFILNAIKENEEIKNVSPSMVCVKDHSTPLDMEKASNVSADLPGVSLSSGSDIQSNVVLLTPTNGVAKIV